MDPEFRRAARLDDLPPAGGLAVRVFGRDVALFKTEEGVFAIEDRCPHQLAPLSDGRLCGRTIECRWHGWTFDLSTGSMPGLGGHPRVERFPVRIEDGWVLVGATPMPPRVGT